MRKQILLVSSALSALTLAGAVHAADAAAAAALQHDDRRTGGHRRTARGKSAVDADRGLRLLVRRACRPQARRRPEPGPSGPNANYTRANFGGYNFKIRGIGTDVITGFGGTERRQHQRKRAAGRDNNFANTDFYDVERVEVLRGPQGTLYGRNATGGAVDIITAKPTDSFGGFAQASYGNYNAIKFTGALNLPLAQGLDLRVAGFRYIQDGFGENTYLDRASTAATSARCGSPCASIPATASTPICCTSTTARTTTATACRSSSASRTPDPPRSAACPSRPAGGPDHQQLRGLPQPGLPAGLALSAGRLWHGQHQRHPGRTDRQSVRHFQRHGPIRRQPAAEHQPA